MEGIRHWKFWLACPWPEQRRLREDISSLNIDRDKEQLWHTYLYEKKWKNTRSTSKTRVKYVWKPPRMSRMKSYTPRCPSCRDKEANLTDKQIWQRLVPPSIENTFRVINRLKKTLKTYPRWFHFISLASGQNKQIMVNWSCVATTDDPSWWIFKFLNKICQFDWSIDRLG